MQGGWRQRNYYKVKGYKGWKEFGFQSQVDLVLNLSFFVFIYDYGNLIFLI